MKNIFNTKLVLVLSLAGLLGACSPQVQSSVVPAGNSSSSIIGGVPVKSDESIAKTTVALVGVVKGEDGKEGQFICTGSLLADNVVLTAGHCLPEGGALYVVFATDLSQLKRENIRPVDKMMLHPQYGTENDKGEDAYDIALVRFSGAKADGYETAQILKDDSVLKKGTSVTLAGYGLTDGVNKTSDDRLRKVDVKVYQNFGQTEMILDQSHGKGACHGDSGGPAFLNVGGVPYVWGVTSRGAGKEGADDCSLVSVYTRVQAHDKFIQDSLVELSK